MTDVLILKNEAGWPFGILYYIFAVLARLFEEAVNNLRFGLVAREAESHKLI